MKLFSTWADQSLLARTGTVLAALLVVSGMLALVGAVWSGWRAWVRSLMGH